MATKQYADDRLFRFVWLTKNGRGEQDVEFGYGRDVADAFSRLGYGGGAARALDFWREVDSEDFPAESAS
jgi:hypothetical protein